MFGVFADPDEISVSPGSSVSVPVTLYTTGAMPDFHVRAVAAVPSLVPTLDKSSGNDGTELTLTVKATSQYVEQEGQNIIYLFAAIEGYATHRALIVHAK
jgi:hypothetical protein